MTSLMNRTVWASAACAAMTFGVASADVISFQNGLNGYVGTEDVSLVTNPSGTGTVNTGAWDAFPINTQDTRPGLIRFQDIFGNGSNQVPLDATINSVTLRLFQFARDGATTIRAYPMLTDWTEGNSSPGGAFAVAQAGESTLQARHYRPDQDYAANPGDAWGTDGQAHTGPVRKDLAGLGNGWDWASDDTRLATASNSNTNGVWIEWDLTALAQDWQDGSQTNYGVFMNTQNTLATSFRSSEYADDPSLRPMLVADFTLIPEPGSVSVIGAMGWLLLMRRNGR